MEDMLYKKQEYLECKITAEVAVARKNAKTNKRAALQVNNRRTPDSLNSRHWLRMSLVTALFGHPHQLMHACTCIGNERKTPPMTYACRRGWRSSNLEQNLKLNSFKNSKISGVKQPRSLARTYLFRSFSALLLVTRLFKVISSSSSILISHLSSEFTPL